jgi:hypothetical protein
MPMGKLLSSAIDCIYRDSCLKQRYSFILSFFMFVFLLGLAEIFLFSDQCIAEASQKVGPEAVLVDNFEKPGSKNSLGGDFGAFADQDGLGYCYLFFVENKEGAKSGNNRYSLFIQWDTSKKGAYSGYWSDLKHSNLEDFNYLSFMVKGTKGGEIFKVGLRGPKDATYESKILMTDILSQGVTTEWKKVLIPLKQFTSIEDWKDINIFSINFENAFGSGKGSIIIDNITFEK